MPLAVTQQSLDLSENRGRIREDLTTSEVEHCIFMHGSAPDSYLLTEPGYDHFWDAEKTGCIGFMRHRKYLHVVGGICAPADRKAEVLRQFTEYAEKQKLLASFFSICEAEAPMFRELGYQVSKFGEQTTISLTGHHWQGKPYSWVRRQVSYVSRQGIEAREILVSELTCEERTRVFEQLKSINQEHLSEQLLNHELRLLEGGLYPDQFYRRRLFVASARETPDRWEAFVVCTPMNGGKGWGTEMYRSRNDAPRGVTPFLIASLIDQLKQEQAELVSLCLVPAINCGSPLSGDSRMVRFLMTFWEKRLNFLFNTKGLCHFKSRFRPEFSPAYLCVRPKATVGSTFSFLQSMGLLDLDFKHAARHLLQKRKKKTPSAEED